MQYVSGHISKQLSFWVGTKREFEARFLRATIAPIKVKVAARELAEMRENAPKHAQLCVEAGKPVMTIWYEDLFGLDVESESRMAIVSEALKFLNFPVPDVNDRFWRDVHTFFDPGLYKWSGEHIYECIPGIKQLEAELGDEYGKLFS